MKTAIISFDPNIAEEFKKQIGEENVRVYIDSISMLKELDDFKPIFIVYDASAGDFAFDDLKFLLSRDKVKDIEFKVLYSKEQPIEDSEILSQDIDIYEKNTELYKVISDILEESKKIKEEETKLVQKLTPQKNFETQEPTTKFQSPKDVEEIYSQDLPTEETFEEFTDIPIEDINYSKHETSKSTFSLEEEYTFEMKEEHIINRPSTNQQPSGEIITLNFSKKEIENTIVKLAVDKLVSELKEKSEIKEIFENVKLDFVNRINFELETIKKEIKQEVKANIFKKLEKEIFKEINTELKDYIAEQITIIIKEKISQAFKM
ncbi:MAG TPA: hypothetical protein EYH43_04325 [Persephonella sp.]|nr:hypothetical protein [Hydrogenothermaceae bacterium]HIQ25191.1 hypothetical protein [Persephonella sp.]